MQGSQGAPREGPVAWQPVASSLQQRGRFRTVRLKALTVTNQTDVAESRNGLASYVSVRVYVLELVI